MRVIIIDIVIIISGSRPKYDHGCSVVVRGGSAEGCFEGRRGEETATDDLCPPRCRGARVRRIGAFWKRRQPCRGGEPCRLDTFPQGRREVAECGTDLSGQRDRSALAGCRASMPCVPSHCDAPNVKSEGRVREGGGAAYVGPGSRERGPFECPLRSCGSATLTYCHLSRLPCRTR